MAQVSAQNAMSVLSMYLGKTPTTSAELNNITPQTSAVRAKKAIQSSSATKAAVERAAAVKAAAAEKAAADKAAAVKAAAAEKAAAVKAAAAEKAAAEKAAAAVKAKKAVKPVMAAASVDDVIEIALRDVERDSTALVPTSIQSDVDRMHPASLRYAIVSSADSSKGHYKWSSSNSKMATLVHDVNEFFPTALAAVRGMTAATHHTMQIAVNATDSKRADYSIAKASLRLASLLYCRAAKNGKGAVVKVGRMLQEILDLGNQDTLSMLQDAVCGQYGGVNISRVKPEQMGIFVTARIIMEAKQANVKDSSMLCSTSVVCDA